MIGAKFTGSVVALAGVLALGACGEGGGPAEDKKAAGPQDKVIGSWGQDGDACTGLTMITFTETEVVMKAWGKSVTDTIDGWEEADGIILAAAQLPELGITSEDKLPMKVTDEGKLDIFASASGAGRSTPPEFSLLRCEMK